MRSNGIPVEFEDLLSRAGRRVLAGTLAGLRRGWWSADSLDADGRYPL